MQDVFLSSAICSLSNILRLPVCSDHRLSTSQQFHVELAGGRMRHVDRTCPQTVNMVLKYLMAQMMPKQSSNTVDVFSPLLSYCV